MTQKLIGAAFALLGSVAPSLAVSMAPQLTVVSAAAPEIDAQSGVAALAALISLCFIVSARFRRAQTSI